MSNRKFDWVRIILLFLAVTGLLLSLLLLRMGTGQQDKSDLLAWACGQTAAAGPTDCDKALASEFSRIVLFPPRPVPVAAVGMGYFTALGFWLLMVSQLPGKLHRAWAVPALLGLLGLLASAFYVYIMVAKLGFVCRLCAAVHVINLPIVLGIWYLWLRGGEPALEYTDPPGRASCLTAQLWKIPVLALAAGLAVGLAQVRDAQTADAVRALESESVAYDRLSFLQNKPVDIAIDPDDAVYGPADAPHTVVIFSDFQCPWCAGFEPILKQVQTQLAIQQAARAGKVISPGKELEYAPFRIVFKHFPLCSECNKYWQPLKAEANHKYACQAAAAAEAARRLGGNDAFWKMHEALYANRAKLPDKPYRMLAERIGLDGDEFEKVLADPQTMASVLADIEQGKKANVRSTPAIFLDGRRIERPLKRTDPQHVIANTVKHWGQLLLYTRAALTANSDVSAGSQPAVRAATTRQLEQARARARVAATQSAATQPADDVSRSAPE